MYDAGLYTCVIENSLGNLSRSFELIVQGRSLDRPIIISKSTNSTQYEGDNVTFECLFYSDSSPFVQWFVQRNTKQINDNELDSITVILHQFPDPLFSISPSSIHMEQKERTMPISFYSFLMDQDLV